MTLDVVPLHQIVGDYPPDGAERRPPVRAGTFRPVAGIRPVPGAVPGVLRYPLVQGRQADWPVGAVCGHAGRRQQESRGQPRADPLANLDGFSSQSMDSRQERPPHNATPTAQRRVEVLESSCASHVRTRTTPLRHYFSSATIAADLHSAAPHALGPLSATR